MGLTIRSKVRNVLLRLEALKIGQVIRATDEDLAVFKLRQPGEPEDQDQEMRA